MRGTNDATVRYTVAVMRKVANVRYIVIIRRYTFVIVRYEVTILRKSCNLEI